MPRYVVSREGNRFIFQDQVGGKAVRDFLYTLSDAIGRGYQDLILDFSACDRAYPEGMLPIVCVVDSLRERDIGTSIVLPASQFLARLFYNANWAHFLDPASHEPEDIPSDRHIAVRRYTTFTDQQQVVNDAMDIVMRSMELERDVLSGLEWSINEITDNVLNHAEAERGGLVQVSTFKETEKISFVVADSGRGILASMREGFPKLRSDGDALLEAVKHGVTRNPDAGQGNGLAGTLRIAAASGGSFKLTSGRGQLEIIKPPGASDYEEELFTRNRRLDFQGTVVSAELGTGVDFNLADVLGPDAEIPHEPWDVIDADYTTESGVALTVVLAEESAGFGTRQAGEQIRTKLKNLLAAEPDKPLMIDWSGIPLISSSFADEAIGRLFVELGPVAFSSRVHHKGIEPLVRSLIDRAVMQRIKQSG